jgi:threonine dehydratase
VDATPPSLEEIRAARRALGDRVRRTPVWTWEGATPHRLGLQPVLKLELWQHAGSFKPRGALLNMMALDPAALAAGVTAVSAGNHAMAVGYAASVLGTSAKVVMPKSANPARVDGCRAYGAQVVLVDDVHAAFEEVKRIELEEGRSFVHPFEGKATAIGTATVGLELLEDAPDLDAVIVPIGGGGLLAGMAAAVKALAPRCLVFGVEPDGADTMHRSFAAGHPCAIDRVRTIADSLGAPHAAPYSFGLCRQFVDALVRVDDDALCRAMALLFSELKLAVEPAGAAATAALVGPLAERLRGLRVGLVLCGANIDPETFTACLRRAAQ